MNLELCDKVVLVTGGAKGIGEGICRVLTAEGATAVIVGRNAADNETAVRTIEAAVGCAWAVTAELTNTDECRRAVDFAVERFGRIDGLVNNAGVNDGVSLETGDTERFLASLRKNLVHYHDMARATNPRRRRLRSPRSGNHVGNRHFP
jgi:L-fucose dehydrogenase